MALNRVHALHPCTYYIKCSDLSSHKFISIVAIVTFNYLNGFGFSISIHIFFSVGFISLIFIYFLVCFFFDMLTIICSTTQILVTIFLVANVSAQILAGVPDCIHANDAYGYSYPKPAIQLTEGGISAYHSVSPAVTTITQGNAIKYSSLEESAYTSVTPASVVKQIVSAPLITKSYVSSPIIPSAIPPTPVYTKAYLPPIAAPVASVAPVITKSFLRPVNQYAYTAPLSKVATYTPTSSLVSIPAAVKTVDYSYPKIATGYHAASVA